MRSASIAVDPGDPPAFIEAAQKLGEIVAENGVRLIYGGGSVGLMGALQCVLERGGRVTGIIPGISDQAGTAAAAGARTDHHATCTSAGARC